MTNDEPRSVQRNAARRPGRLIEAFQVVFTLLRGAMRLVFAPVLAHPARSKRSSSAPRLRAGTGSDGPVSVSPVRAETASSARDLLTRPEDRVTREIFVTEAVDSDDLPIMTDDLGYGTIAVTPSFNRGQYAAVFRLLQAEPGPKLLDLSDASTPSSDIFEALVASWTAEPGLVPRLAIALAFDHWAVFRDLAAPSLSKLASKEVVANVFYHEQTRGMSLLSWFAGGPIFHNVAGVIHSLSTRWQPSAAWPLVLTALSELLNEHARDEDGPGLFTEAARISLGCGGAAQAAAFAREALQRLDGAPSVVRCKALRALGVALVSQGQETEGLVILDDAIAMASVVGVHIEGASARCQAGLHALNRQDFGRAETHFRGGIALLTPDQPDFLAILYHNLALATLHRGSREAAHYVTKALELRTNKQSLGAREDRKLLASIHDGSVFPN